MKPVTEKFRDIALDTLNDSKIQANLNALYEGFNSRRIAAGSATNNWEDLRDYSIIYNGVETSNKILLFEELLSNYYSFQVVYLDIKAT